MRSLSKLIVVAALAAGALPATRGELGVGDRFPSLREAELKGGPIPDVSAHPVTVVDFWASWCAPCKASFPAYARVHADFAGRGVLIVGVGVDEKRRDHDAFIRRMEPPFAVLHDEKQLLVRAVQVPAMPTAYVLDRSGRVRFIHRGFHGDSTVRELRAQIERLLAEEGKSQ